MRYLYLILLLAVSIAPVQAMEGDSSDTLDALRAKIKAVRKEQDTLLKDSFKFTLKALRLSKEQRKEQFWGLKRRQQENEAQLTTCSQTLVGMSFPNIKTGLALLTQGEPEEAKKIFEQASKSINKKERELALAGLGRIRYEEYCKKQK